MRNKKDAIRLFLQQEGKELRGKKNSNIIILFSIFLAAILSVGFGGASLSYLKYKMDDPFVDWVEIYAVQKVSDHASVIPLKDFVESKSFQKEFHFRDPEDQHEIYIDFEHSASHKPIQMCGRNINSSSEIFRKIFDNDNVIKKNQLGFSDNQFALIVTQDALKKIGYSTEEMPQFVNLSLHYDDSTCVAIGLDNEDIGGYGVSFPIYAIVRQLPGMYSFMFSDEFLHQRCATSITSWDITDDSNNGNLNYVGEETVINKFVKEIKGRGIQNFEVSPYRQTWSNSLSVVTIPINEDYAYTANQIDKKLEPYLAELVRIYDFAPVVNDYELDNPEKISVHIEDLRYIRTFQDALYDQCGYKIDMTNVDAKENFNFVQRMGNVLSVCIIIIASLLICFFIYFMLSSHFQRIQKNLGTFKAFGISNKVLTSIYMRLMIRMIVISFASALIVSFGLSKLFDLVYPPLEEGYPWIDVFVLPNIILFVLVMVATYISTRIVNRKLNNTPGDLIYNRIK